MVNILTVKTLVKFNKVLGHAKLMCMLREIFKAPFDLIFGIELIFKDSLYTKAQLIGAAGICRVALKTLREG